MKKILTFTPLAVGISSAIIYIFNAIQFRVISNSAAMLQILTNLRIYLYISIAGFVCYFVIKIVDAITHKKKIIEISESVSDSKQIVKDDSYEPFEEINNIEDEVIVSLYDEEKDYDIEDVEITEEEESKLNTINDNKVVINEIKDDKVIPVIIEKEARITATPQVRYCTFCGTIIDEDDIYCSSCGKQLKKSKNSILKNIINVIEIVILILVIYFSLNMLFDYKEKQDPEFTSPFKVRMTK